MYSQLGVETGPRGPIHRYLWQRCVLQSLSGQCYCTYVFSYGKAVEMKFLGSLKLPVYQLPLLGRLSVEYSMTPFKSCSFLKMIKKLVEIFGLYCKHTSCRSFKNWYAVNIVNRQIPISLCPGRTYVTLTVIDLGSILLNFQLLQKRTQTLDPL